MDTAATAPTNFPALSRNPRRSRPPWTYLSNRLRISCGKSDAFFLSMGKAPPVLISNLGDSGRNTPRRISRFLSRRASEVDVHEKLVGNGGVSRPCDLPGML